MIIHGVHVWTIAKQKSQTSALWSLTRQWPSRVSAFGIASDGRRAAPLEPGLACKRRHAAVLHTVA